MKRSNLEKYYLSLAPIKSMLEQEIITKSDYQKAESYLANKYCINKGNLYRLNLLTNPPKRVIYSMSEEEVNRDEEDDNKTRRITELGKTH
jgi:hypothetical protein